jgi:hypothetical protein
LIHQEKGDLVQGRGDNKSRQSIQAQGRGDSKTKDLFIPSCSPHFANTTNARQKRATRIKANIIKGPNHLSRIDNLNIATCCHLSKNR